MNWRLVQGEPRPRPVSAGIGSSQAVMDTDICVKFKLPLFKNHYFFHNRIFLSNNALITKHLMIVTSANPQLAARHMRSANQHCLFTLILSSKPNSLTFSARQRK